MKYKNEKDFQHEQLAPVGVLLANLGTPKAPTARALRPYLRQFLSDPRVIEKPKWQWYPILYSFILTLRPAKSAKLYKEIWTEEGSPLLIISQKQQQALQEELSKRYGNEIVVSLGMTYGEPSIESAIEELKKRHIRKLLVLPLYPQYSGTSTASVLDTVFRELSRWRWIPELRTVSSYHDFPGYISCLAASVHRAWDSGNKPEKLVMSYHGIPKRYFFGGDPYHCQCQKTSRLLAEELGLNKEDYIVSFQSLFGSEAWLTPGTEEVMIELAKEGVKSVDVIAPGFSADCLETIQEVDLELREVFEEHGGKHYRYIPALNDQPDFMATIADMLDIHLHSWAIPNGQWSQAKAEEEARLSGDRAKLVNQ